MKHVIVIADPPGGKHLALKRALSFQRQNGAKITVLGFCYASRANMDDLITAKLSRAKLERAVKSRRETELRKVLDALITTDKAKPKKVDLKVLWGKDIARAVIAYCQKHPADLLIKSGHRSESWLYQPTDWQLLRECPLPVMITTSNNWKKKPRIVAAIDFSSSVKSKQRLNDKIVAQAKSLSVTLQEELHIAVALKIPQVLVDMDLINPRKYVSDKRKSLQPFVEKFCLKHQIDLARVHIRQGEPEKVIPSIAASLKADVVVAGTIGRKGLKGKLMGNTAEKILGKLHTDIVAVKP